VLPFNRLEELAQEVPGLQSQILRLMSKDLSVSSERATDHTAEEKLAGFLLGLSMRTGGRADLTLVMPRRDIASYLRLATETVSRLSPASRRRGSSAFGASASSCWT
jgi:CRP/FNR family transcriptional regulator